MKKIILLMLIICLVPIVFGSSMEITDVIIKGYIDADSPTSSPCTASSLYVGNEFGRISYIAFNLSQLSDKTINEVNLSLYYSAKYGLGCTDSEVDVKRLDEDWITGSNCSDYDWNTPINTTGSDLGTIGVSCSDPYDWVNITLDTTEFTKMVNGSYSNYGFELQSDFGRYKVFNDFKLVVDYTGTSNCPDGMSGNATFSDPCQITDCDDLTKPGYYELQNNINFDASYCLNISSNDVILNGSNYWLNPVTPITDYWYDEIYSQDVDNLTVFDININSTEYGTINLIRVSNIDMYNIEIKNDWNYASSTNSGFKITNSSNVTLYDINLSSIDQMIYFSKVNNSLIHNVSFLDDADNRFSSYTNQLLSCIHCNNVSLYNNEFISYENAPSSPKVSITNSEFVPPSFFYYGPVNFYNNLFNISHDAGGDPSFNLGNVTLNTSNQSGNRVFSNGTNIGGNYWTNSTGGYSDTCTDSDSDGFCDSSYLVDGYYDYLAYSNEYTEPDYVSPSITSPSDAVLEYKEDSLSVDFDADEEVTWYVNNSDFNINVNGLLSNSTVLDVGVYSLNITANDTSNNTNSTPYQVTVQDTTVPILSSADNDTSQYYNSSYANTSSDFNATDHSTITWYINDTRFNIDSEGIVSLNEILGVGTYNVNVTVNDTYNNKASTIFEFIITKGVHTLSKTYNEFVYLGNPMNIFTSVIPSDLNFSLYRNGTLLGTGISINDTSVQGAGIYNYTLNSSGNFNYSSQSTSFIVEVVDNEVLNISSLTLNSTAGLGANLSLVANVVNNTQVEWCNFTFITPSVTLFNDVTGTYNGSHWLSNDEVSFTEEGVYNYNVSCGAELGSEANKSNTSTVSYNFDYNPKTIEVTAYQAVSEQKNITIYMYDGSNYPVNYSINVQIQNDTNFTIGGDTYIVLTDSDSLINPDNFTISLQADATLPYGLYQGNITLNNTLTSELSYVYFNYSIAPPSGVPELYSSLGNLCVSSYDSECSNIISLAQDSQTTFNYVLNNTGSEDLNDCYLYHTNQLNVNWLSYSPNGFSVLANDSRSLTITVAPTTSVTPATYYGYFYVKCLDADQLNNTMELLTENRPINKITVTRKTEPSGGGGSETTIIQELNLSEELTGLGICNNDGICQEGENPLNCARDCSFDFDDIFCTPVFDCGSWNEAWFVNALFILVLLILVVFEYRRRKVGRLTDRRKRR